MSDLQFVVVAEEKERSIQSHEDLNYCLTAALQRGVKHIELQRRRIAESGRDAVSLIYICVGSDENQTLTVFIDEDEQEWTVISDVFEDNRSEVQFETQGGEVFFSQLGKCIRLSSALRLIQEFYDTGDLPGTVRWRRT